MSNDEILTVKETAALLKTTRQQVRKMIANEELPAFWSVGCLTHKSESFRLRFVLFTAIRSADFRCFRPDLPAPILFWVKTGSGTVMSGGDWRTATLRHSPRDLSSYHKWSKDQRFMGVFVHHGSRFGLGDGVKVTTVDILIRCDGVVPW